MGLWEHSPASACSSPTLQSPAHTFSACSQDHELEGNRSPAVALLSELSLDGGVPGSAGFASVAV